MAERGGDSMKQRVFDGMEYVYAVYRGGSFQKAAEKLFVSQPSVSASVRRVEERVGSRLFDRSRKPLALTRVRRGVPSPARRRSSPWSGTLRSM